MRALRVLVVDDDEDHRFFIQRALAEVDGVDVDVDVVGDGQQALDYLAQDGDFADRPRPDLILLDLRMPKRSGLEVLEAVKADPELRTIPISILSTSDRPEDVEASYGLGGNAYIRKSSTYTELASDIADAAQFWGLTAVLPAPRDR